MKIAREHFYFYAGYDFEQDMDMCLVLALFALPNQPFYVARWHRFEINLRWNWLPEFLYVHTGWGSHPYSLRPAISSAAWTGRPWEFLGWEWQHSFRLYCAWPRDDRP